MFETKTIKKKFKANGSKMQVSGPKSKSNGQIFRYRCALIVFKRHASKRSDRRKSFFFFVIPETAETFGRLKFF